jgi:hypothetical protein
MGLNCKAGDLAVVVRSEAGNLGKIVRCVKFLGVRNAIGRDGIEECAIWMIDQPLKAFDGTEDFHCEDEILRPIRDNPGEDETLTWCPTPADAREVKKEALRDFARRHLKAGA